MKRFIEFMPAVVITGGLLITIFAVRELSNQDSEVGVTPPPKAHTASAPETSSLSEQDRTVVQQVFESPEMLDTLPTESIEEQVVISRNELLNIPGTMSLDQESGVAKEAQRLEISPSKQNDLASFLTTQEHSPDLEANRKTAAKLMSMRQRRVSKLGLE